MVFSLKNRYTDKMIVNNNSGLFNKNPLWLNNKRCRYFIHSLKPDTAKLALVKFSVLNGELGYLKNSECIEAGRISPVIEILKIACNKNGITTPIE